MGRRLASYAAVAMTIVPGVGSATDGPRAEGARLRALAPTARGCLPSGDATEAVTAKKVVPPSQAIAVARRSVAEGDIIRASLCRDAETLVYRIFALRGDGRVVRVIVDAASGRVTSVR